MKIKCILFDRDGTLGELDDVRFPQTFHAFTPIKPIFDAIRAKGYFVGVISNQSSIARGTAKNYDFAAEFQGYGAHVWKICPHDSGDECDCRKPKSGLLLAAAKTLGVNPQACMVVGDRLSDVTCANTVGAQGVLVLSGNGEQEREQTLARYPNTVVLQRFDEVLALL